MGHTLQFGCKNPTDGNTVIITAIFDTKWQMEDLRNILSAAPDLLVALERFLESSPCQNGCDPNDMTCDTNFARWVIAKAKGQSK